MSRLIARCVSATALRHPVTGQYVAYAVGTEVDPGDAIVNAHPWAFETSTTSAPSGDDPKSVPVESATAGPGEVRRSRPRPKPGPPPK